MNLMQLQFNLEDILTCHLTTVGIILECKMYARESRNMLIIRKPMEFEL